MKRITLVFAALTALVAPSLSANAGAPKIAPIFDGTATLLYTGQFKINFGLSPEQAADKFFGMPITWCQGYDITLQIEVKKGDGSNIKPFEITLRPNGEVEFLDVPYVSPEESRFFYRLAADVGCPKSYRH